MTVRTYRLPSPDRTGWLMGMGPDRLIPGAVGLVVGVVILSATGSLLVAGIVVLAGVAIGSVRPCGLPLTAFLPAACSWTTRRRYRQFQIGLIPGSGPVLPHPLDSHRFVEGMTKDGAAVGVAVDGRCRAVAATVRVSSPSPFLLASDSEQERRLAAFGEALGTLCCERGQLLHLRWTSFAAPEGPPPIGGPGPAAAALSEVAACVAEVAVHEVLVTVTLASERRESDEVAGARVCTVLDRLVDRLIAAGFDAEPLGPADVGVALRHRLDPAASPARRRHRSLAELAGVVVPSDVGPSGAEESWDGFRVDGSYHRAYQVRTWPRSPVRAEWMADLLLTLPPPRSVCVLFVPVAPRASRRAIERDAARLDSDAEQRRRAGFRVGADHDAAREALTAREAEFTAGHTEVLPSGVVVLSARDATELDDREAEAFSAAAAAGVELAPWFGFQAPAVALCLPLAFVPDGGSPR